MSQVKSYLDAWHRQLFLPCVCGPPTAEAEAVQWMGLAGDPDQLKQSKYYQWVVKRGMQLQGGGKMEEEFLKANYLSDWELRLSVDMP